MSVDEVLCQISTFLAAGHETTASAMTWCLYALAKDQPLQHKLREALRAVEAEIEMANVERGERLGGGDEHEDDRSALTDAVNKCEYLDWVVRESLRLHAPVTNTMRVCMRDVDEIPVSAMSSSGECSYPDTSLHHSCLPPFSRRSQHIHYCVCEAEKYANIATRVASSTSKFLGKTISSSLTTPFHFCLPRSRRLRRQEWDTEMDNPRTQVGYRFRAYPGH